MPLGDLLEHLDPLAAEFGKFQRARHSDLDGLLAGLPRASLTVRASFLPLVAVAVPLGELRTRDTLLVRRVGNALASVALLVAKNEAPVFGLRGSPLYEARSQKQLIATEHLYGTHS